MDRRVGAVTSAAITLLVFTVLPLMAQKFMPPEIADVLNQTGVDLGPLLNQIAIMGAVASALILGKGFVEKTSTVFLLLSLIQNGLTLVITILFFGLGDIAGLGSTSISFEVENAVNIVSLDMRLFVQLAAATVILKMMQAYMEWSEARKAEMPPGRIEP